MNPESSKCPLISTNNDTVNHADKDCEEDCELPEELAPLLRQESKFIQPHEEPV